MSKLKAFLGYTFAALSPLIVLISFLGLDSMAEPFIAATGLTVSANFTGGEVVQTVDHAAYQAAIHRPVFDALIGERKEGFVQIDWAPLDALPSLFEEEIDANGDGEADMRLQVDTADEEATLTAYAPWVLEVEGTYRLPEMLAVRVKLHNPNR
jgi:hypothetical protein